MESQNYISRVHLNIEELEIKLRQSEDDRINL